MATKTKATKKAPQGIDSAETAEPIPAETISIPMQVGPVPDGVYLSNHYNVTGATRKQRRGMRRLVEGAQRERLRLESGKTVDTPVDVIRWLLEQVDDAAAPSPLSS